jgi:hypothetical protein
MVISQTDFHFNGTFLKNVDQSSTADSPDNFVNVTSVSDVFIITNQFGSDLEYEFASDSAYFGLEILEKGSFRQTLPIALPKLDQPLCTNTSGVLLLPSFSTCTVKVVPIMDMLAAKADYIRKVAPTYPRKSTSWNTYKYGTVNDRLRST